MLAELVVRLDRPGVAYVLPESGRPAWYPGRYHDPPASNEPWLTEALAAVRDALAHVAAAGVPPERTVLAGFSQGGCLAAEVAAAGGPRVCGAVAILAGALLGGADEPRAPLPDLRGLRCFVGASARDPWVALADVERTAAAFAAAGATVELRRYDEPEHAIYADEVDAVGALLDSSSS